MSDIGIIETLALKIDKWAEHKSHSLNVLSTKSGISYPTVRRIARRICKTTGSNTAQAILEIVEPDKAERKRVMNKYFNGLGDLIDSPVLEQGQEAIVQMVAEQVLQYQILGMCDIAYGIHEDEIRKKFGSEAIKVVDDLISSELIEKNSEGIIKARQSRWTVSSWRTAVRIAISSLSLITDDSIENNLASLFHHSEGLNGEGVQLVKEIELKFVAEIKKIIQDPRYQGPVAMFILSAIAPFNGSITLQKGQQQ